MPQYDTKYAPPNPDPNFQRPMHPSRTKIPPENFQGDQVIRAVWADAADAAWAQVIATEEQNRLLWEVLQILKPEKATVAKLVRVVTNADDDDEEDEDDGDDGEPEDD